MELIVDGCPVQSDFAEGTSVEEAVREVHDRLRKGGRMVVALSCEGTVVPGHEMAATLRKPLHDFTRIEITTGTPEDLVAEAMDQAQLALDETDSARHQTVQMLTEGRAGEGIEALSDCVNVWRQVHEAVARSVEMLQLDLQATVVQGRPLADVLSKPRDALLQVRDALQAQDHVLLSDVLQYEFDEARDNWHAVITTLRSEARERMETPEGPAPDQAR